MEQAILVFENEFSKQYKIGLVSLYVAKAYDEKKDLHYVVCSIPSISDLDVMHIQMPFEFEEEGMRDTFFKNFEPNVYYHSLRRKIIENKENLENEGKNDSVPV